MMGRREETIYDYFERVWVGGDLTFEGLIPEP